MDTCSPTISKIAAALSAAQGELGHATKGSVNPHFKNRYADLAAVVDVVREPFFRHGLSFTQLPVYRDGLVGVRTVLLHASGEFLSSELLLPVGKATPQQCGSALTYARRYSLAAMAGIAQDDDDGHAASNRKPEPPRRPERKDLSQLRQAMKDAGVTAAWMSEQLGRDDFAANPPTPEEVSDLLEDLRHEAA